MVEIFGFEEGASAVVSEDAHLRGVAGDETIPGIRVAVEMEADLRKEELDEERQARRRDRQGEAIARGVKGTFGNKRHCSSYPDQWSASPISADVIADGRFGPFDVPSKSIQEDLAPDGGYRV